MKFKDVKILSGGLTAQIISIAAMWNWTGIDITGVIYLSFFVLVAGAAVTAWAVDRKKVPAKQYKPPKIYTYTSRGNCVEGAYREVKIG